MIVLATIALMMASAPHSGGTDANGCHRDRRTGTRHCHTRKSNAPAPARRLTGGSAYYPNCAAARAAGAAPVHAGDPGYSRKLDRDGDGVGCE